MVEVVNYRFRLRRALKATFEALNDVLLDGELGRTKDTGEMKAGNGTDGWNALDYLESGFRLERLGDVNSSGKANGKALVWNDALGQHIYVTPSGGGGGGSDRNVVTTVTTVSGVAVIDASLGDFFDLTLTENVTDWSISNVPDGCELHVRITQTVSAKTVAWPVNWAFPNGNAVVSTTPTARDILVLKTFNAGESWSATLLNNADVPSELDLGTDAYWANVKALLRFDTSVTADLTGRTWTANGAPAVNTSIKKYGTGALGLNGSSDVRSAIPSGEALGTMDFTLEGWVYRTGSGTQAIFQIVDGTRRLSFYFTSSANLNFYSSSSPSGVQIASGMSAAPATWTHVALCRASGAFQVFLNGVASAQSSGAINSISIGAGTLYIGQNGSNAEFFSGCIDEVRFTVGVARYTGNFTPPDAPFPAEGP